MFIERKMTSDLSGDTVALIIPRLVDPSRIYQDTTPSLLESETKGHDRIRRCDAREIVTGNASQRRS